MGIQVSEISELLKIFIKKPAQDLPIDKHIEAAMEWLCRAQDAAADGGVSIRFSLFRGWESSYPETTGYIIPTFFKYYMITGNESFKDRAMRMAEWELSIQQDDGSYIGGCLNKKVGKLVFDTGQIIFGLLAAYRYSGEDRFLKAAIKAGNWLVKVQDEDGAWRHFAYNLIPHAYYSRVAWSILELYQVTGDNQYVISARRNIDWVLLNQKSNGWFNNNGFNIENNNSPYTHTIAYTIRGLLETGILLNEQRYINAARKSIDEMLKVIEPAGFFWGKYDANWKGVQSFTCLTGNAQISIICSRLYEITNDAKYSGSTHVLNKYLTTMQNLITNNKNIRGAIAGSYPIWGEYERFSYPNWAAKFFVDALILEKENS